ncbi:RNA-binding protein [Mesorhizobium sp. SP-1A]|uniref:RNA-binding protein n=1 Tax=Mesorhizobium sp. SP-1A TaxID=3077840 RepID=UPI0028F7179C|nr:RNA-binding protein [Mesorhizobium sp. SP-1A]
MNDRTCIVTRKTAEPDDLIRFVVGPDSAVVPDLKRNLPGRGCWVSAQRLHVDKAAAKGHFARAFKRQVAVPPDLGAMVDRLLARAALGSLGLARKAGAVALGAAKVETTVRSGKAILVLHALEGAEDGIRKITQARRAMVHLGGPAIPAYKLFAEAELGLALGGTNVIHAAVLATDAGRAALKRMVALDRYRGGSPDDLAMLAAVAGADDAAEDLE